MEENWNVLMRDSVLVLCLLLLVWLASGCGTNPTPSLPSATLAPSPVQAATLSLRTVTPTLPSPTRSSNSAEVTFRWDVGTIITDVDDVTELAVRLMERPGILGAYGDELLITVVYDPQQTTPERILRVLDDLGFPAKKP